MCASRKGQYGLVQRLSILLLFPKVGLWECRPWGNSVSWQAEGHSRRSRATYLSSFCEVLMDVATVHRIHPAVRMGKRCVESVKNPIQTAPAPRLETEFPLRLAFPKLHFGNEERKRSEDAVRRSSFRRELVAFIHSNSRQILS